MHAGLVLTDVVSV